VSVQTSSKAEGFWQGALILLPAERWMLAVVTGFGVAAVLLTQALGRDVNWPPFLAGFFGTLGLMAIGAYVRGMKDTPRLALALIGVAIFMGFTAVSSVFIFALFPLPRPLIDPWLLSIDAGLGYHWPGFVEGLAVYPFFARALGYLYHTSLPQIVLTICLLATLGRTQTLHRFLLVGILTLVAAVAIWWLWPSIGPSGFQTIPEAARLATGLYFDSDYGAYLRQLVETGPARISPEVMTGVVAFPSYHMVMACMVVWYTRGTVLFLPALGTNALMIPATLSHGGHHLIDLLAGVVVFAVCAVIAGRILPPDRQPVARP
jgi:PAP2 superfamily